MREPLTIKDRSLKRAVGFQHIGLRIDESFDHFDYEANFSLDAPLHLAQTYFLISDCYVPKRNKAESLSDNYKKAAISALAVMRIRPFVLENPDNVTNKAAYLSNSFYALACAKAWLGPENQLRLYKWDVLKRIYYSLERIQLPSLQPLVDKIEAGENPWGITEISLSSDEIDLIDEWVLKFEMLSTRKI